MICLKTIRVASESDCLTVSDDGCPIEGVTQSLSYCKPISPKYLIIIIKLSLSYHQTSGGLCCCSYNAAAIPTSRTCGEELLSYFSAEMETSPGIHRSGCSHTNTNLTNREVKATPPAELNTTWSRRVCSKCLQIYMRKD